MCMLIFSCQMANRDVVKVVDAEDLQALEAAGGKAALSALTDMPLDLSSFSYDGAVWKSL